MRTACGDFYLCDSVTQYCEDNECQECSTLCDPLKDKLSQCHQKCKDFIGTVAPSTTTKIDVISLLPPEEGARVRNPQDTNIGTLIAKQSQQEILTVATLASVALLLILWTGYTIYRSRKNKKAPLKLSNLHIRRRRTPEGHVYETVPAPNNTRQLLPGHRHQLNGLRSSSDSNLPMDPRTSLGTTNGTCGSCSRMPQQATDYTGLTNQLSALRVDGSSVPSHAAMEALLAPNDSTGYHLPGLLTAVPHSDSGNGTSTTSSSSTPLVFYPPGNARLLPPEIKDNTMPKTLLKQGHSDPQLINEYKVTVC